LDPIEGLNLALFLVQGSEGFTIYACDGTIVGVCIFEYVPPLPGGTAFPTNVPSSSPTFSCDDCDDGDLCTTDSCDRQTGECIFTPIPCGTDEACDSFTRIPSAAPSQAPTVNDAVNGIADETPDPFVGGSSSNKVGIFVAAAGGVCLVFALLILLAAKRRRDEEEDKLFRRMGQSAQLVSPSPLLSLGSQR
jgi:hypothetical protein